MTGAYPTMWDGPTALKRGTVALVRHALLVVLALGGTGCFAVPSTRGLDCFSDGDCRDGQICRYDGSANALRCSEDVSEAPGCEEVCDHIAGCGVTQDDCVAGCTGTLDNCRVCLTSSCDLDRCGEFCAGAGGGDDNAEGSGDDGTGGTDGGDDGNGPYDCEVSAPAATSCDAPDAPGSSPVGECSVIAQDCPAGLRCVPYDSTDNGSWDSTRCVGVGAQGLGDPCTCPGGDCAAGEDDCGLGYTCLPGSNGSFCFELCGCSYANPTCDETPNAVCSITNENALAICTPACNPLDLDSCPTGFTCVDSGAGETGFSCFGAIGSARGAPCTSINSCLPGDVCVTSELLSFCDPENIGCCVPFCTQTEGDASCPEGWTGCTDWWSDGAPDPCLDGLGVCTEFSDDEPPPDEPSCGPDCALLMHFDGDFTDSGPNGHVFSVPAGNAHANSTGMFGSGVQLGGSWLEAADHPSFGFEADFTVDLWFSNTDDSGGMYHHGTSSGGFAIVLGHAGFMAAENVVNVWAWGNDGAPSPGWHATAATANDGVWHHVAVTREGGTMWVFLDGIAQTAVGVTGPLAQPQNLIIGDYPGVDDFSGVIDELRVLDGTAAWTSDFTPPTGPYTYP